MNLQYHSGEVVSSPRTQWIGVGPMILFYGYGLDRSGRLMGMLAGPTVGYR